MVCKDLAVHKDSAGKDVYLGTGCRFLCAKGRKAFTDCKALVG